MQVADTWFYFVHRMFHEVEWLYVTRRHKFQFECRISDDGAADLAESLKENTAIKSLNWIVQKQAPYCSFFFAIFLLLQVVRGFERSRALSSHLTFEGGAL
jgi:hypothetical protein